MNKKRWAMIAAAGAAAALLAWAFAPRPVEVETGSVIQGLFEQAIEEDGRTRLKERYTISAPVTALLTRITLNEGDRVSAGDTVAVLTPVMSAMVDERSTRESMARLKAATASVERANSRIERAKVAQEEARLEHQRNEKLAAEGFVSPSRLDTSRLSLDASRRELETAYAEREVAVQEQAQASAALQPATVSAKGMRTLTVKSPVSGVVLRVTHESEATIAAGAALLDVGDPAQMEVLCELLTADAVQAQPGRRVVIERWGGPALEGKVRRVEPAAFTKVSALGVEEQRVNVLIDIDTAPASWRAIGDGFRVSVKIITASVDRAVLVPVGSVFPHGEGMAVYLLDGRRARLQPVQIGGRNSAQAWVRSGLVPGQQVVVYPPPGVTDGRRVQVRSP